MKRTMRANLSRKTWTSSALPHLPNENAEWCAAELCWVCKVKLESFYVL